MEDVIFNPDISKRVQESTFSKTKINISRPPLYFNKSHVVFFSCQKHLGVFLDKKLNGHVHKYEAMLWTLKKWRKTIFYYKMIHFSLRELKYSGNMYFSYTERLASAKVKKVHLLQRNDKVTFLLIYHLSGS